MVGVIIMATIIYKYIQSRPLRSLNLKNKNGFKILPKIFCLSFNTIVLVTNDILFHA